jgi:hypothetical protein
VVGVIVDVNVGDALDVGDGVGVGDGVAPAVLLPFAQPRLSTSEMHRSEIATTLKHFISSLDTFVCRKNMPIP